MLLELKEIHICGVELLINMILIIVGLKVIFT